MATQWLRMLGIVWAAAFGGCASIAHPPARPVSRPSTTPRAAPSRATPAVAYPFVDEFHRRLADNGSITFRSSGGKAYRMDSDLEITFFPDGKAHVFDYGLSLEGRTGSYRIDDEGRIAVDFKRSPDRRMAMVLWRDEISLLLRPADHHTRYIMGNDPNGFWPFRPIWGGDEREVLIRVRQDMSGPTETHPTNGR